MTSITPALLQAVGATPANAALYAPLLDTARIVPGDAFNTISSRTGICMLVAQLAHESGGFSVMTENLNYQAGALVSVFGTARISQAQADMLGRTAQKKADQEGIANVVYGGAWGLENLGNREPGDGWLFRGAGPLQLTGRANFTAWGATMHMAAETAADYARTPRGGIAAALWFWRANGLLVPASQGDVATCTRIINGGLNGLADRVARFKVALGVVGIGPQLTD